MRKKLKDNRGFTLVELLVVIAIIGILAAIITPNAFKAIEKGKVAAAEADYKAIKAAALNYYTDTGTWPPITGNGGSIETRMFVTGENGEDWTKPDGWNGPYLERWPSKNPWGGTYTFKKDASTWDSDDKEERYLELTQVPESAFPILQRDLGNDSVKRESTTKTTVRIIISNDD